ncbi:restriction endonuclease [Carnobacterium divergens]|uniref:Restriction endonuclease type IV Mrr domain-containing protein n=1 Tax=Carnobacterium divergens DSM 20623 TaxID=1449336 RepID=A0A0R2HVP1_CARDV|nr:restriction endonuclease [Carnobacterium divergens]KRN56754.1 hypothetical protein IV74_GL000756 [Carnobacterium divergens DSM 20623]MDO0875867.1 restriction endonuclease [Carnobacterium divergens]SUX15249.1 Uncharacterised protein [Carnobacterium divergens]
MFSKFKNRGRVLEDIIEETCKKIAEDERIDAKISKRIPLIGSDKATHEFDVLYEYEHFGLQYRVAIECKSWNKSINKSQLTDFAYKLKSVGNINGIFLSESNLQRGAKLVSEHEDIKFIRYSDFRSFSLSQNEKYLFPNYRTIGDPFWMFINKAGEGFLEQNVLFNDILFLFESKYYAMEFQKLYLKEENNDIELVGVSQRHLKDIQHSQIKNKFQISLFNPIEELKQSKVPFSSIGSEELDWFIR